MGFANLTWRQARALAEAHIERFEGRLASHAAGRRGVRVDECERYSAIWLGIRALATPERWDSASLAADEQGEIQDAINSGDYYELLERHKPS